MKICVSCDDEFDENSPEKRRAGGLRTHCPDCSVETAVRYAGFAAGEGKQASVQIMSFASEKDRARYLDYWRATSGLNTGKNCQLAFRGAEPKVEKKVVTTQYGNTNHKGRAE
jgi:hypothetical protein